MNKKFLCIIFIFIFCLFSCSSVFATTGTDLIDQYLNTYGSTRVNFAEAGFNYYYEGYNGTTTWREWLFCVNEPTVVSGKITKISGPFYILSYTQSRGFCDNTSYLNNSTDRNASSLQTTQLNGGGSSNILFSSSYYPNCVNSNISAYNKPLEYYDELINPSPKVPYIEMTKELYTESDETIDLHVYPNSFDISNYGLVFNRYENSGDSVGTTNYFSPSPSQWLDYWNVDNKRYELNLKDFVDFSFSDVIFYDIGIFEYNSSGDNTPYQTTEYFKYSFSESYDVAPGGTFDITPIIYVSTEESTAFLTCTIGTKDVVSGLIYYRIDNGSWIRYTGPFIVDRNCTVYAHIYTSNGSSGYSSKDINNIVLLGDISNRISINENHIAIIKLAKNGYYNIFWKYFDVTSDCTFLFSDNGGYTWQNFKNFATFEESVMAYKSTYYIERYPKLLYFKYMDSNGVCSDILTFNIVSSSSTTAIKNIISSYNNSGEYIEDKLHDFTNTYDPSVTPNYSIPNGSSSVIGDIDFSSNDSLLQSALKTIPTTWKAFFTFFTLINGIWVFIPTVIMELCISLILIKFFIALIGFLKS